MAVLLFVIKCRETNQEDNISDSEKEFDPIENKLSKPQFFHFEPLKQKVYMHIHVAELDQIRDNEIVRRSLAPIVHDSALPSVRLQVSFRVHDQNDAHQHEKAKVEEIQD